MNAKTEQKERSHETILDSAARLVREKGIGGVSVAEVMKGAGLTVGGFYAHFDSKRALVDAALRRAAAGQLVAGLEDRKGSERVVAALRRYLSRSHRDDPTSGCPLPAVVGEIATTAPEHAAPVAERVESMAAQLGPALPAKGVAGRHLALGLVALMVGGLSLARALRGTALSDEVLKACRVVGELVTRESGQDEER
jgi:TetR/AcrR family transcriptional repressor of nem operon